MWIFCLLLSAALALAGAGVIPDPVLETNELQLPLVGPAAEMAELVGDEKVQTEREAEVAGLGGSEPKGWMEREVDEMVGEGETRSGCPYGWYQYGDRCFTFVSTHRKWAESERFCGSMNANLASVHSVDEDFFIQDVIRRHTHGFPLTWIGGCDGAQEGVWLWSNGRRFDYSNWHHKEPNNSGGAQHCLLVNFREAKKWDDFGCQATFPSVCARNI